MRKEWYVKVHDKMLGPMTPLELENTAGVDIRSYVWKEGFERWKRIEEVEELLPYFKKKRKKPKRLDLPLQKNRTKAANEEIVLEGGSPPFMPYFLILLLLIALAALAALYYH
jgi:hypothetical protein